MTKTSSPTSANDDVSATAVATPRGQITLEDFSIDDMMASFDDKAKEEPSATPPEPSTL